jgi:hypothetical protein
MDKEKRKAIRIKKTFTAQYYNKATECWNMTSMRDLSVLGACINTDEELPLGDIIEFRLRVPTSPNTWIDLKAKIVTSGKYITRVEFKNPTNDQIVMIKSCIEWFLSTGGIQ